MAAFTDGYSPEQRRAVLDWVTRTTEILREQTRVLSTDDTSSAPRPSAR